MLETKASLDAAMAAKLPSLMQSIDARLRRQTEAAAGTQAAIVELEAAIGKIDADQRELDLKDGKKK